MSEITLEMQEKVATWIGVLHQNGWWYWPDGNARRKLPDLTDLTNLFKWAVPHGGIICGAYFRYYPGITECELTFITEAGLDTLAAQIPNESPYEHNYKATGTALFLAVLKLVEAEE